MLHVCPVLGLIPFPRRLLGRGGLDQSFFRKQIGPPFDQFAQRLFRFPWEHRALPGVVTEEQPSPHLKFIASETQLAKDLPQKIQPLPVNLPQATRYDGFRLCPSAKPTQPASPAALSECLWMAARPSWAECAEVFFMRA